MNKITLNHLYSKSLNIYGDLGNIIALQHHARNLGIDLQVVHTEISSKMVAADIYFIGGGQDEDQVLVFRDLLQHKKFITEEVKKGKIFLLVCGGFQLFGKYFIDASGNRIEGLGILDMTTEALDEKVSSRCIGNVIVETNKEFVDHWKIDSKFSKYLVGFENHGGQTHINKISKVNKISNPNKDSNIPELREMGNVLVGFGNNSQDKTEGAWQQNIIGTYLHGSILPKNPHLALAILQKAVGESVKSVDLSLEKKAHEEMLRRLL